MGVVHPQKPSHLIKRCSTAATCIAVGLIIVTAVWVLFSVCEQAQWARFAEATHLVSTPQNMWDLLHRRRP
jgi:hypothetical protein